MADPTSPPTPDLTDTTASTVNMSNALNNLTDIGISAHNAIGRLNNQLEMYKNKSIESEQLTRAGTLAIGGLGLAVMGTKDIFTNFNGIDFSGLNTFSGQYEEIKNRLVEGNPVVVAAKKKWEEFGQELKTATKAGIVGPALDAIKQKVYEAKQAFDIAVDGADKLARTLAKGADIALHVGTAYLQLSAKTGDLDKVFDLAGPNLDKINSLYAEQINMLDKVSQATKVPIDALGQYYAQLGTIPGALTATIAASDGTSKSMNTLTAAILLAKGAGRAEKDIMEDMHTAVRNYGNAQEGANKTMENALKFTARMGEISKNTKVELEDVRNILKSTSEVFKMYGNEAEGAANMTNEYLGALKATGLSSGAAIDVVKDMTGALGNMRIEQKAFLSAQTGGAGGLMGGFQIDKMLKEGQIDKVMDKVRQQMTQQMGRIVTLDEASKSQGAAMQMQKQVSMLQQGPLGQFAKSPQEAYALLETFKAKQEGRSTALPEAKVLDPDVVPKTIDKGNILSAKTNTLISESNTQLRSLVLQGAMTSLGLVNKNFTEGSGVPVVDTAGGGKDKMRKGLEESRKTAATQGGVDIEKATRRTEITNEAAQNKVGEDAYRVASQIGNHIKLLKDVGTLMFGGTGEKEEPSTTPTDKKYSTPPREEIFPNNGLPTAAFPSAPVRVGQAAATSSARQASINAAASTLGTATVPVQGTTTQTTTLPQTTAQVHITAYCAACHNLIHGSEQSHGTNVGQKL